MGYTTDFEGQIAIVPSLNKREIEYMQRFNATRRMNRSKGPYFADRGADGFGQDGQHDVIEYNNPPEGQPSLWCGWTVSDDGKFIEWDGGEKFYHSPQWMTYIIKHFLGANPVAGAEMGFLKGHKLNGEIYAQGEESDDMWKLTVKNNKVTVQQGTVEYK
tara:strand:- start:2811 stop:3290 length:480 start_codon:yes stop_codon:yes gene_type:complete